jgi:hypothetical protein
MKSWILKFSFLALIFAGFSSRAGDDVLTARMRFNPMLDGSKAYSAQWFPSTKTGLINLVLLWAQYDNSVRGGFKLTAAREIHFIAPLMPSDCQIKTFKGGLANNQYVFSAINMTLTGDGCAAFIGATKTTPMQIGFVDVPHTANSDIVPALRLEIIEIP